MKGDFYVSADGNDKNPGTKSKPFASVERACDAVRKLKKKGLKKNIKVLIRAGMYQLSKPLAFGTEDSGTDKYSITYAAYPGEKPVLSGGRMITGWKKLSKEPAHVNPKAKGKLWTADIPEVKNGKWFFRELFINGERCIRARSPNSSCFRAVKVGPDRRTSFIFKKGDLKPYKNLKETELVFYHDWCTSRIPIKKVDETARNVTLAFPVGPGVGSKMAWGRMDHFEKKPRYFIENALELLDSPGEWFLDRSMGKIYYYPKENEDVEQAEVIAPKLKQLLSVKGGTDEKGQIQNLHFKGLTFSFCAFLFSKWGMPFVQAATYEVRIDAKGKSKGRAFVPTAAEFASAVSCSIENCRFTSLGGSGLIFRRGCHKNRVTGCEFRDISGNGIMIGDGNEARRNWKKDPEVIVKDNIVSNNLVHFCGRQFPGSIGIYAGITDGTKIRHNEIRDLPYSGISAGWMWDPSPTPCKDNIIEFNHIHHIMQELSDGGGIYTLGSQPGTVIRGNYIHDIPSAHGRAESNGMFLDQGSSEFIIEGNAITAVGNSSLRYHQARNLAMRNNVLIVRAGRKPYMYNACSPDTMKFENNRIVTMKQGKSVVRITEKGKIGKGLLCDGISSCAEVPHSKKLEPAQFTVEAWIYMDEYPEGKDTRRWIVNKNGNEWKNGHYALVIQKDKAGVYLNIGGGKENCFSAWSRSGSLKLKTWHHIAAAYNGKELTVYVDGKKAGEAGVNKKRAAGSLPLAIGKRQDGFVYFKGVIDEVSIFNQALSSEDLEKHAAQPGNTNPDKHLIKKWGFEQKESIPEAVKKIASKAGIQAGTRFQQSSVISH
ncbi:LamG-like jellyroll fold domain-containing protein [Planctomycetota bacterium]